MVTTLLHNVFGIRFNLDPRLFLLNITEIQVPKLAMKLLIYILTAARSLIALFWKRTAPPMYIDLWSRIKNIRTMEYMTALSQNKVDLFHQIWTPWDIYSSEREG